jgi:RNAse (barnase) inhibitor barstar
MNNKKETFHTPCPPWLYLVGADHSELTNFGWSLARNESLCVSVRFLRGKKMTDLDSLFNEFAAALQFPYYFGENWAAFDECLADLEWIRADAFILIVFDLNSVLSREDEGQFATLIDILQKVAEEWSRPVDTVEAWARPSKAFHVIFQVAPCDLEDAQERLKSAVGVFQNMILPKIHTDD